MKPRMPSLTITVTITSTFAPPAGSYLLAPAGKNGAATGAGQVGWRRHHPASASTVALPPPLTKASGHCVPVPRLRRPLPG